MHGQMRDSDLVARLVRLVPCSHDRLVDLCLRLLFNLSFDAAMREQMVNGLASRVCVWLNWH